MKAFNYAIGMPSLAAFSALCLILFALKLSSLSQKKRPWAVAHGLDPVNAQITFQGNGQFFGMWPPRLPRCAPGPSLLLRCLRLP